MLPFGVLERGLVCGNFFILTDRNLYGLSCVTIHGVGETCLLDKVKVIVAWCILVYGGATQAWKPTKAICEPSAVAVRDVGLKIHFVDSHSNTGGKSMIKMVESP